MHFITDVFQTYNIILSCAPISAFLPCPDCLAWVVRNKLGQRLYFERLIVIVIGKSLPHSQYPSSFVPEEFFRKMGNKELY